MSRSLIRKNQLHPDIADLVSGYGDNFFITPAELDSAINFAEAAQGAILVSGNQTISGVKTFATGIVAPNLVYNTGNQTINGVKTFATGIFAPNLVYNTGDQMISGTKIFGSSNTIDSTAGGSTILGGNNNTITGDVSNVFIANGSSNVIGDTGRGRPFNSYIGNGFRNGISGGGRFSAILNGDRNRISSSENILIGNGLGNVITGGSSNYSVLMNGAENSFTDTDYVFLGNGTANCLGLDRTGVSDTSTKATHSSIINGSNNRIIGDYNIIGGGTFNKITGSFIIGNCCQAYSRSNVIVGGANNSILNSSCSAILGGRYNEVIHNGATIIGDGSINVKTSRGECSLLLYFQNGIYLESPIFDFIGSRPTVNGTEVLLRGDFGLEKSLTPNLYLRTSSQDTNGNNAGGIVSAVSENGIKWTSLSRNVNFPSFSRDASTIWYDNKWVSVYTNAFTSTGKNFGIATSTNLTSWITGAPVLLTGAATVGTGNNVWAPEWFVDNNEYYVLVRLSTTAGNNYGTPGMGYVRALNPGTWTSWTEWTPFDNSVRTDANDFSIVKKDNLYWLFSHGGTHLNGSQPLGLDIVNNITLQYSETPFSGYSSLVEITEPLRGIIRSGNSSAFFEGPSVVNIGGSHWRLYFQDGLDNSVWSIDSFNDFQSWPTDSLRKNLYEGFNGGGHGTVFKIDEKNFVGLNQSLRDINSPISIGAVALAGNETISGVKTFATGIVAPNLVYNTGNQTISGVKTFASYPTVNGIRVLLSGEPAPPVISTTYSGLTGLKAATGLTPGQLYRISDFHLKWYNQSINDTGVKSGLALEPLIVLALSGDKISHEAKSELYPQDTVYYDIDASGSYSWGTQNINLAIPDFKGWIYRRIDNKLNIDIPWDWRHITVNCCRPIVTGIPIWTGTTNYNRFSVVRSSTTTGKLYYSIVDSNSGQSVASTSWWLPVSNFVEGNTYFSTNESFGFRSRNRIGSFVDLPADQSTRIQQPTFTSSLTGQGTFSLTNSENIKIEGGYSNVILGSSFNSNNIGNGFYSNTIGSNFSYNNIGNLFNFNTIGNSSNSNTIGNSFYSNNIANSFSSNAIGNSFNFNTIGSSFSYNNIANSFSSNAIGNSFNSNNIASSFTSNAIGNVSSSNVIGDTFYYNTVGNSFYSNNIGNLSSSNTIGNNFYYNTVGNRFRENVIGIQFDSNAVENEFNNNNIGNGFFANSIGNHFASNTIGDNFRLNTAENNLIIGNITGATHVYNAYNTRLFKNSNLTGRLSYFNGSDQLVVTDPSA